MTLDEFLQWVQLQEVRYEFDGFQPVAMTGGSRTHVQIGHNLHLSIGTRLRGSACSIFGSDAAIQIVDGAVRYPDALVTCTKGPGTDLVIPEPVIVLEVLGPSSSRTDRIVKTREYQSVSSIRRYVILEYASAAASVFFRTEPGAEWTATTLTADETLHLPEIGIAVPLAELYENVDLPPDGA